MNNCFGSQVGGGGGGELKLPLAKMRLCQKSPGVDGLHCKS